MPHKPDKPQDLAAVMSLESPPRAVNLAAVTIAPAMPVLAGYRRWLGKGTLRNTVSFMVSMFMHLTLLVVLGLMIQRIEERRLVTLTVGPAESEEEPTLITPSAISLK